MSYVERLQAEIRRLKDLCAPRDFQTENSSAASILEKQQAMRELAEIREQLSRLAAGEALLPTDELCGDFHVV
jgi:hypothetical protein